MLELAVLGLLIDQDLHGYELRKRLKMRLGMFANLSFGSLYPALARLEAMGAVSAVTAEPADPARSPLPLTGSLSGERAAARAAARSRTSTANTPSTRRQRAKKVYRITEIGRALFRDLLTGTGRPGDEERDFPLRLSLARHLAPQARLSLLERRRMTLAGRLEEARNFTAASSPLDSYARALMEHRSESIVLDIAWLDRLIEAERASLQQLQGRLAQKEPSNAARPGEHRPKVGGELDGLVHSPSEPAGLAYMSPEPPEINTPLSIKEGYT